MTWRVRLFFIWLLLVVLAPALLLLMPATPTWAAYAPWLSVLVVAVSVAAAIPPRSLNLLVWFREVAAVAAATLPTHLAAASTRNTPKEPRP